MSNEIGMRSRTRARDIATVEAVAAAAKRRKLEEDAESRISSPLRNSGIVLRNSVDPPEVSVFHCRSVTGDQFQSLSSDSDHGGASVSCGCSNGSSMMGCERVKSIDPKKDDRAEVETSKYFICNESTETTLSSPDGEESDGTDSAAVVNGGSRISSKASKANTSVAEDELEEFFSVAEREIRNKVFESTTKYNFDFVNEEPLDGRYEWVRLKP